MAAQRKIAAASMRRATQETDREKASTRRDQSIFISNNRAGTVRVAAQTIKTLQHVYMLLLYNVCKWAMATSGRNNNVITIHDVDAACRRILHVVEENLFTERIPGCKDRGGVNNNVHHPNCAQVPAATFQRLVREVLNLRVPHKRIHKAALGFMHYAIEHMFVQFVDTILKRLVKGTNHNTIMERDAYHAFLILKDYRNLSRLPVELIQKDWVNSPTVPTPPVPRRRKKKPTPDENSSDDNDDDDDDDGENVVVSRIRRDPDEWIPPRGRKHKQPTPQSTPRLPTPQSTPRHTTTPQHLPTPRNSGQPSPQPSPPPNATAPQNQPVYHSPPRPPRNPTPPPPQPPQFPNIAADGIGLEVPDGINLQEYGQALPCDIHKTPGLVDFLSNLLNVDSVSALLPGMNECEKVGFLLLRKTRSIDADAAKYSLNRMITRGGYGLIFEVYYERDARRPRILKLAIMRRSANQNTINVAKNIDVNVTHPDNFVKEVNAQTIIHDYFRDHYTNTNFKINIPKVYTEPFIFGSSGAQGYYGLVMMEKINIDNGYSRIPGQRGQYNLAKNNFAGWEDMVSIIYSRHANPSDSNAAIELMKKRITALFQIFDVFHKMGIYHFDLHPGNVVFHSLKEVTVMDFGRVAGIQFKPFDGDEHLSPSSLRHPGVRDLVKILDYLQALYQLARRTNYIHRDEKISPQERRRIEQEVKRGKDNIRMELFNHFASIVRDRIAAIDTTYWNQLLLDKLRKALDHVRMLPNLEEHAKQFDERKEAIRWLSNKNLFGNDPRGLLEIVCT
jgi:hypothetical protein